MYDIEKVLVVNIYSMLGFSCYGISSKGPSTYDFWLGRFMNFGYYLYDNSKKGSKFSKKSDIDR